MTGLVASVVAGLLWDRIGHSSVFIFGVVSSGFGIISLAIGIPNKRPGKITA